MKRWFALPHFLARSGQGGPASALMVSMHYRDRSNPDEIENFRIGQGSSFFLTFLSGGMIDLSLEHIREIRFENVEQDRKNELPGVPSYHVSVSLTNGKTLEGYSDSLYSFSGTKQGTAWTYSCHGGTPERLQAQSNLSRIVVRKVARA